MTENSSRTNPKTTDEGDEEKDDDDGEAFSLEALRTLPPNDKKLLLKRLRNSSC